MLGHRMLIFVVGAVLGILGIAFELDWLIYAAVGVLLLGVIMRLVVKRRTDTPD